MSIPKFYSVTDVQNIPLAERDVDGVYFLRNPTGFEVVRVADTSTKDFIYANVQEVAMTLTELNTGTGLDPKKVNAKTLHDWLVGKGYITDAYTKVEADNRFVPYTGANKPINLNTQNLRIGGDFDKSLSTFERSHLSSNETSGSHFTRITDVASLSIGAESIIQRDCIVITLPIRTSTYWVMEVDIVSRNKSGIFNSTPIKLLIGAYDTSNSGISVTAVSGADNVKSVSFCRDENNNTVIIIRPKDGVPTHFSYGKVSIANFYHSVTHSSSLAVKSNYQIDSVLESSLTGLTTNGTISNAQFTRDSYLWNKGDLLQSSIDNWNTAFGWGNHSGLYALVGRTITAGNGLSGGGTLAANRTFTLGTPSPIGLSTTNEVTASSHTHELDSGTTTAINNGQTAFDSRLSSFDYMGEGGSTGLRHRITLANGAVFQTEATGFPVLDVRSPIVPGSDGSTSYMPLPEDTFFNKSLTTLFHQEFGTAPTTQYRGTITVKGWTGNYCAWQLSGPANAGTVDVDNWYLRSGSGTNWRQSFKIWHDGNLTNVSQLNNDAGYITSTSLPTVNDGQLTLSTGTGLSGSATFTANQDGNSAFSVSLSPATLSSLSLADSALQAADIANKVDKETGKGLSTNDYTTAEKSKLSGIATNANNYVHPANHPATIITQTSSYRFVTDAEKSTWNSKASTAVVTTTTNGLMSSQDKVKLNGLTNYDDSDILGQISNKEDKFDKGNLKVDATLSNSGTHNGNNALVGGGEFIIGLSQNTLDDIDKGLEAYTWVTTVYGGAGTVAEANAGVDLSPKSWAPNVLKSWLDGKGYITSTQINNKADKITTITGVGSIEGGGSLGANRTLDLTTTTKEDINKGVAAYNWSNHATKGYLTSLSEGVMKISTAIGATISDDIGCIICTVAGSNIGLPNPASHEGRVIKFTCTFTGDYVELSGYPIKIGSITVTQLGGRTSGSLNTPRSLEVISDGTEWVVIHRGL